MPFAGLVAAALVKVHGTRLVRPTQALVAAALVAAFVATWKQTRVWQSSITLWSHVAEVEPSSYIAHHNLAIELYREGRADDAIESLRRSLEAHPGEGNVQARMSLGDMLLARGARAEVEELYLQGLEADPKTWPLIQRLEGLWGLEQRSGSTHFGKRRRQR